MFFQCIQGTIRRFNSQRHSENANLYNVDSYFVEKLNGLPRTDKYKDVELPKLPRARRQDVGGDPEAYSFNLTGDDSQFAQVLYSGEGSQVNALYMLSCESVTCGCFCYKWSEWGACLDTEEGNIVTVSIFTAQVLALQYITTCASAKG